MTDYNDTFRALLSQLKLDGRYRTFAELERIAGGFPAALQHRPVGTTQCVAVWCSNDYLGMEQRPDILDAMHRAIHLSGAGTGGTRNISGTNRQHVALEADLHGKENALIFTSGWISNLAALGTLGRILPDCAISSDALNRNSMVEGIRRSGAEHFIFRHNDVGHLEELMAGIDPDRPRIMAFESIYSMDHMSALTDALVDVGHARGWLTNTRYVA
jgi:5-aminolevulinate synthase